MRHNAKAANRQQFLLRRKSFREPNNRVGVFPIHSNELEQIRPRFGFMCCSFRKMCVLCCENLDSFTNGLYFRLWCTARHILTSCQPVGIDDIFNWRTLCLGDSRATICKNDVTRSDTNKSFIARLIYHHHSGTTTHVHLIYFIYFAKKGRFHHHPFNLVFSKWSPRHVYFVYDTHCSQA